MKKKTISLFLALALCLGLAVPVLAVYDTPTFSDVPKDFWGYTYIEQAAEKGWVKGMGGGKFEPNGQVTYAQFTTMLCQAFFRDEVSGYTGTASPWYVKFCMVADQNGLFKGTNAASHATDNAYVGKPLNRYEMAEIIYNVTQAKKLTILLDMNAAKVSTADWDSIPINYRVSVAVAKQTKVINGMDTAGTYGGTGNLTRAQACVVLIKLDEYLASQPAQPEKPTEPNEPVIPDVPEKPPVGTRSPFAFKSGENVQQMMDRLNKEAPAYKEGYLTNGKPITEANIKEMLDSAKESMPDYTPWGPDSSTHYTTFFFPGYGGTGGCDSFGAGLSDYIFGKDAPVTEHQDFDHIKVGDVIHMKDSSTGYEHTVLVTDVSKLAEEGFFQRCSGNTSRMVEWRGGERLSRWSETKLSESYIYTRY